MNTLSEHFRRQLNTDPNATYSVMITQKPGTSALKSNFSGKIQPVEGLKGIYKARLSGHDILKLSDDATIQAIEPDDQEFHTLQR